MVSGQLEESLRHEIESYIEGRLSGVRQEISELQSQLNESLTRLLDRQGDVQLDGSVAASILEHLRAAHEAGDRSRCLGILAGQSIERHCHRQSRRFRDQRAIRTGRRT